MIVNPHLSNACPQQKQAMFLLCRKSGILWISGCVAIAFKASTSTCNELWLTCQKARRLGEAGIGVHVSCFGQTRWLFLVDSVWSWRKKDTVFRHWQVFGMWRPPFWLRTLSPDAFCFCHKIVQLLVLWVTHNGVLVIPSWLTADHVQFLEARLVWAFTKD